MQHFNTAQCSDLPERRVFLPNYDEPLPLAARLLAFGHEQLANEPYDWHGLRRGRKDFVVIQVSLDGEGRLHLSGMEHSVTPGQTMLLGVPQDHRYFLPPNGSWRFCWLILDGAEPLRMVRHHQHVQGAISTNERLAATVIETVRDGFNKVFTDGYRASAAAYGVAMAIAAAAGPGKPHAAAETARIDHVCTWADEHLHQSIDVDELAAQAHMSRAHFSRRFRAIMGDSPARWLLRRRLERAARLLTSSDIAISAIAESCGFQDANYFAKAFNRYYHCAPRDFRANDLYRPQP